MKVGNGEERRTGAAKEKKILTKVSGIAHEAKTKSNLFIYAKDN